MSENYEKWWGGDAECDLAQELWDFYEETHGKSAVYWESYDDPKGFFDTLEGRPEEFATGGYTSDFEGWGQEMVSKAVENGCDSADSVYKFITGNKERTKRRIYVVTAIGVGIDTEVHIADTEDKAKHIVNELFKDFGLDKIDMEEITSVCWKGYSGYTGCDIEVEIHEKLIEK